MSARRSRVHPRPRAAIGTTASTARITGIVGSLDPKVQKCVRKHAKSHRACQPKRRGARIYNHPVVGEITLEWDTLTSDAEPDQQLIIYTAEPGSHSEQALRILASWAASEASEKTAQN